MSLFFIIDSNNQTKLSPQTTKIQAEILETPDINGNKLSVIVKSTTKEKLLLVHYIETEIEKQEFSDEVRVGLVCTFDGLLRAPQISRNPNAFNYKQYLYTQKIHWIYEVNEISLQECYPQENWSISRVLLKIRESGIKKIESYFEGSTAGVIQALIYGERTNIESEIINSYQSLGLIHLLAISGLHVSLMTGMVYFTCIRLGITRESTAIFLFCSLPVYIIIAGGSPSVIRSVLMSMLLFASMIWWKKGGMLDVISLACLCMLAINPYYLTNIGFQLSFMVSAALILSSKAIFRHYPNTFTSLFVVSFLSQIASLPILLHHFYEFSLLSLPLNMLYVPLYSVVILPFALITVFLLAVFDPVGQLFADVLSLLLDWINGVTVWASQSHLSVLTLGKPGIIVMVFYSVTIIYFLICWEKRKTLKQFALCAPIVVLLIHLVLPYLNPYGEVTMLDVGQGDSIYIELPFRKGVYLIDTGGTIQFEQEEWTIRRKEFSTADIILPYLKSRGVRKIDKLIITHGDQDHIGGAQKLVEKIQVKEIVFGKTKKDSSKEAQLKKIAFDKEINITHVERGQKWEHGGYTFHVLAPLGNEMKENDNSIVLYAKLGGLRWLFTGDTEKNGELDLIKTYKNLRTDVLKVGHHGSKTSSTEDFIELLNPKVALIPVGQNNRFNHPHPDVINRFKMRNMKIYQTDKDGAIQYHFFRNSGTFMTTIP